MTDNNKRTSRRGILKQMAGATLAGVSLPMFISCQPIRPPAPPQGSESGTEPACSGPAAGPNDQIDVGIIGCGRRNGQLVIGKGGQGAPPAHARIVAVADFNLKRATSGPRTTKPSYPGLPRAAGPQGRGRGHLCHARALALSALHPCLPGRQGHVRRTALEPHDPRGTQDDPGRPQVQAGISDRRAAAVAPGDAQGRGTDSQRPDRQDPIDHRLQLSQRVRVQFRRAADSRVARLGRLVRAERGGALPHRSVPVARSLTSGSRRTTRSPRRNTRWARAGCRSGRIRAASCPTGAAMD